MKIINQNEDELVLKDGNGSGIILGVVFILLALGVGYYANFSSSPAIWIALVLLVVGLGAVFMSSSIIVDINKTKGDIVYQKKSLLGGKTTTYAILDVLRIETRKEWRMENASASSNRNISMPRQVLVAQSVIVFKDGRELPLDHQKNSSSVSIGPAVLMAGQGAERAIANQVATFLGVPFQEITPPGGGSGINFGTGGGIQL